MPVSPDISVFGKNQGFSEYQRANEEFAMRKALQQAQIQALQQKAVEFDVDKLGERAAFKLAGGQYLTPEEAAAFKVVDAKSGGIMFDPVTQTAMQKPRLSERLNIGNAIAQPTPDFNQPPQPRGNVEAITPNQAQGINDVFGEPTDKPVQFRYSDFPENSAQPVVLSSDISQKAPEPFAASKAAMDAEIAAAGGNRKLVQDIRTKYAGANTPDKIFQRENIYRDEFNALTKDFRIVQDAWSKIQNVSDTPAGDLSLIYATAKLNDPGSVVREQDFAQQAKAGDFGDRVKNMVNQLATGNRLTAEQRKNLINEAGYQYKAQKLGNDRVVQNYKKLAINNGLNPDNVITDYADIKPVGLSSKDVAQSIVNARKAIKAGKSREEVLQKLIDAGIDPAQAGL